MADRLIDIANILHKLSKLKDLWFMYILLITLVNGGSTYLDTLYIPLVRVLELHKLL